MKTHHLKYIAAALAIIAGILMIVMGCTAPPTRTEQRLFDIQTNFTPVLEIKTNIFQIAVYNTNFVFTTNEAEKVTVHTNIVAGMVYQTNVVTLTNQVESYVFKPGAGASEIQRVGGEVGGLFGVGGIVSTAFGFLFSAWAYLRSKKSYATAANIAQTVETLREFIKSLPNGEAYDTQFVQWMQANQAKAGVLRDVLSLLEREVSNPDARVAAQQIKLILEALPKT